MKYPRGQPENRPHATFCEESASPLVQVCASGGARLTPSFVPEPRALMRRWMREIATSANQ